MQFPVLQRCWGIGEEMLHLGGTAWQASLPLFWTRLEFLELLGLFDGGAMPVQSWTQILLKDLQLFRSAQRFEQSFSPAHFVLDKEHIILGVLQSQTWNFSTIKKKKERGGGAVSSRQPTGHSWLCGLLYGSQPAPEGLQIQLLHQLPTHIWETICIVLGWGFFSVAFLQADCVGDVFLNLGIISSSFLSFLSSSDGLLFLTRVGDLSFSPQPSTCACIYGRTCKCCWNAAGKGFPFFTDKRKGLSESISTKSNWVYSI